MAFHRRHFLPAQDATKARHKQSASVLAEETQDLEKKLRQLREAMQKEMQKRDEVRRALSAGTIWSSARPGPLQQITSKDMSASFRQPDMHQLKAGRGPGSDRTKSSRLPDFRVGIGPRRPPAKLPPLSPKQTNECAAERPWSSKNSDRQMTSRARADTAPPPQAAGGSLLEGAFDEERNQAAFLEAVRAWRNGTEADLDGTQQELRPRPLSARPSTPAACMEVQTERPAVRPQTARPRTARPRTYFEKLAERQAGHLASQAVQRSRQEAGARDQTDRALPPSA